MIHRIRIQNFRSLDIDLELDPVTVLVGPSGTGKSNFLEAIRFLRSILLQPGDVHGVISGQHNALSLTASNPMPFVFELEFDVPGFAETFKYKLEWEKAWEHKTLLESLVVAGVTVFQRQGGKWLVAPERNQQAPLPQNQLALGTLTGSREATRAYATLSNGLGCYTFGSQVLAASHAASPSGALDDHATNYMSAMNAITNDLEHPENWLEIIETLRVLNRGVYSVELQLPAKNVVVVTHEIGGRTLPMSLVHESEGFRRFLAHLLALYQSPRKQTMLFEEPENGIHPGALAALAREFRDCPSDGRGQVILTTHSPQFLDEFDIENVRVVELVGYVTRIGKVSPDQVEAVKEQLLRPGELLTVDPARTETCTIVEVG